MKRFSCDFETTTTPEDLRVWAWGVVDIDTLEFFHGTDIAMFFQFMKKNKGIYYFHNLKFDGEFLLSFAMRKLSMTYSKERVANTFDCIISAVGQFYELEFTFQVYKSWKNSVKVYDSLKKLPFSVKTIAEAFHLPIKKGEIDYRKDRPLGYKPTVEELDYLRNDCEIVARALKIQFDEGLVRMTIGSDALNTFISMTKGFENIFPVLPLEIDSDIRRALRGGYTYANKIYQNQIIGEGVVYDVNSMYPWAMHECLMPYGNPVFFEGQYTRDAKYPLYIQHVFIDVKLKPNHIPTLQVKNNRFYNAREYLEETTGDVELWVTNIDLEMIFEQYDVLNITYINGWKFKGQIGIFNVYIDKYMEIKKRSNGAIRQIAKLLLNNLFGKFTSNPNHTGRHPILDEDEIVRYEMNEEEIGEPIYTAVGIFITSYSRARIQRSAQNVYKRFLYADTDSIHLIGKDIPDIPIDDVELGYFKLESTFKRAKYIRAKTYIEEEEKRFYFTVEDINYVLIRPYLNIKCAGMPQNLKDEVTFDSFEQGLTLTGKLMPKKYVGGVILEDAPFTIK